MDTANDYIRIADVGKLIESAGSLRGLYEKRAHASNKRMQPVPEYKTSLEYGRVDQKWRELQKFADANNMNEVALNALNSMVFLAANEHEDINQMLRDIFVRLALYYGEEIAVKREEINANLERMNAPRERALKLNAELTDLSKSSSKEFSRKIGEAEELFRVRKAKLIRSLNKAFEVAGTADKLSVSDKAVCKYLCLNKWLKYDGIHYGCNEVQILGEQPEESKKIFMGVKTIIMEIYAKF